MAVKYRRVQTVKRLLEFKANPNIADGRGYSPLHIACPPNDREIGHDIIKGAFQGLDSTENIPDSMMQANVLERLRQIPADIVANINNDRGQLEIVNLLLEHKADANCKPGGYLRHLPFRAAYKSTWMSHPCRLERYSLNSCMNQSDLLSSRSCSSIVEAYYCLIY